MLKFLLLVVTAAVMLHVGASQPLDVNDVVMGDETIADDGSTAIQDETSEEPIETTDAVTEQPEGLIPELTLKTTCEVDGVVYKNSETIPDESPCKSCECADGGTIRCIMQSCGMFPEEEGCRYVHQKGRCCPIYSCD